MIKHIFILTIVLLTLAKSFAQTRNYESDWQKVDNLWQKQRLPKSALTEVQKIYQKAKAEKQEAQIIKSLVYITGLQEQTRENNQISSIREVEKELQQQKEPAQAILQSMLAGMYWQYLQQNRWQLYNRTNTSGFKKDDIATWTIEDLHRTITALYLASVRNEKLLQQTSLAPYEAIILKGNVRHLRPTLFDLLAHRALDYFKNDERDIKKPAYAFEINQPQSFAPASSFISFRFNTNDSLSLKHKALTLYQDLLRFHLNDAKKDALIDVDADRIAFVYNNSVAPDKEELYEKALKLMLQQYGRDEASNKISFLLAMHYYQQGQRYQPFGDTIHRYKKMLAKELLDKVVKDSANKNNEGWVNSYNLWQQLTQNDFHFETEKVNLPDQPFRALIRYRNIPAVYFRIIRATDELKKQMENGNGEDRYWNAILNANPLRGWQQALPATNDLQEHSVEVKIDALPAGTYFLLASSQPEFSKIKSQLGGQFFHVSHISYVNQGNDYFVLHRSSGQPLPNAAVKVYRTEYDYNTSRNRKVKVADYRSNEKGYFKITETQKENTRRYGGYTLDITHNEERLHLDEVNYDYHDYDREHIQANQPIRIFFFTDRSIYRPGQTVHFKGIAVRGQSENSTIATSYTTKIYLRNANYQFVDSAELTTNEFGSFNGRFVLPQNVLNGQFFIAQKDGHNSIDFSVEEYKRPKFEVNFEKVKDSYKAGDSITITGVAKAYAGNNIGQARVTYRVVRQPRFPYPWMFWRGWFPRTEAMEIAHGETRTDAAGKFIIRFVAIPDKTIDKKWEPVFDYQVYAEVTDINGETRTGNNLVSAGYKSLLLKVQLPEKMIKDSLKSISITTENMNGYFQPALVTIHLRKLVAEQRLIRNRYWQQPDQFVFSKAAFITHFPYDEYQNESDPRSWEKGEVVLSKTDSSREASLISIDGSRISAGHYELSVTTKDADGQEVKDVRYIELLDATKLSSAQRYLSTIGSNGPTEPGQAANIHIGTSANNVFLISQVDKRKSILSPEGDTRKSSNGYQYTILNNEQKVFTYIPAESDRGGFGINHFFVKDNRLYQFSDIITVPWSNKELDIAFATFRDKTLPGSKEQWKVAISGTKADKVAAEMLVSMYDASLDQFRMHKWHKPGLWPVYHNNRQWNGRQNFSSVDMNRRYAAEDFRTFQKIYDQLLLSLHQANMARQERALAGAAPGVTTQAMDMAEEVVATGYSKGKRTTAAVASAPVNQDIASGMADTAALSPDAERDKSGIPVQVRRNFNETAFFFPDLKTDANGTIIFSFTAPEALTRWKLQTLAHTKELAIGLAGKEMVTQKELMVQPNAPRFFRQGDHMEFPVKVVNLGDKEITGQVQLELFDAATNQPVDGWFMNTFPNQYFTVAAGGSEIVMFPLQVPYQFTSTLTWRVTARSNNLSDGEENILPVLTNKILVTETLPLPMKGSGTKTFSFAKLKASGNSETLQHHALTVEYTSNPAWYAVQALPYLLDNNSESADQNWNRYYANALAGKIVQSAPRIKAIIEQWRTVDTAALLSNLQKNEELKSALLEETPWVVQAQSEEQQKKNIVLLFDLVRMNNEATATLARLRNMQSPNGGFVWFKGGPDDRYITQYIITGIGHLKKLGVNVSELKDIINKALPYLDRKIADDYNNLLKQKTANLKQPQLNYSIIQYLYMRSFFSEHPINGNTLKAFNYYRGQTQQFWTRQTLMAQGMIALALHRTGDLRTAQVITRSLKENSINHEELGRYWKNNNYGYSWMWWHAPVETQALMIEAFSDIDKDIETVNELRTWLIKHKQTNNWRTTKATAEACYAMLLQGTEWLANEPQVAIKLGATILSSETKQAEAGTGYFKQTIAPKLITPEMGDITLRVQPSASTPSNATTPAPSWGAVYWLYFEDMDKVTNAATPLQLHKKLFIQKNTDRGPVLIPVNEGTELKVGQQIKARIELRVDRDMEYVHMKDMRATGLEPVNVLSGYKWQGGLGYYETTRDASTSFFFSHLRKGTYVFEYPLFVSHAGNFSNGITTIQSMYAPEFSAHSEGIKIRVVPQSP